MTDCVTIQVVDAIADMLIAQLTSDGINVARLSIPLPFTAPIVGVVSGTITYIEPMSQHARQEIGFAIVTNALSYESAIREAHNIQAKICRVLATKTQAEVLKKVRHIEVQEFEPYGGDTAFWIDKDKRPFLLSVLRATVVYNTPILGGV